MPGQTLDEDSQEKLVVCALYLLFGMALIAMCFKLMQDDVVQKARWLGKRIGIIGLFLMFSTTIFFFALFSVKEESSESESDFDEEIVIDDEDDDFPYEKALEQHEKRTLSSGSSSNKDELRTNTIVRYERNGQARRAH